MDAKITTIRDLVTAIERYPHLNEKVTLQEAIQSFLAFREGEKESLHYSMLFVVNDLKQLVGKLYLMDIMHGLAPGLLKGTKVAKFEGKEGDYLDLAPLYETSTFAECGKNRDTPIKPLVHPIEFSLPADTHVLKALVMMSRRNDFDVPVTDDGTIIGVLRLEDIFVAMCNTYCPIP